MSHRPSFVAAHSGRWELGEGPRWNAATGEVAWVDILRGSAYVATLSAGALVDERSFNFPVPVGAVERAGETWVAAAGTGFWEAGEDFQFREVHRVPGLDDRYRANDASVDLQGRMVAGFMTVTADRGSGLLVRLSRAGDRYASEVLLGDCTIPNGLAWSHDGSVMFHADSGSRVITRYGYGDELTSPNVIAEFEPGKGVADGLTLDSRGNLWAAMWDGAAVHCYSPDGQLLDQVPLPVRNPTSPCFVGADRDQLLVTSARYGLADPAELDGAILIRSGDDPWRDHP